MSEDHLHKSPDRVPDSKRMAYGMTKIVMGFLFFSVLSLSLFFAESLQWETLVWALLKGTLAVVLSWFFILILSDAIIKSIMESVVDMQERRSEGGLLYHFIEADEREIMENGSGGSKEPRSRLE